MAEAIPSLGKIAGRYDLDKEAERGLFDLSKLTETIGQLGKESKSSKSMINVGNKVISSQAKWHKQYQQ